MSFSSLFLLALTSLSIIFSLLFFLIRLKPYCPCDICQSFLTSSWSVRYNNLCDWYTHLLSQSTTGTIHIHVLRAVITANPANVEHILKTRFENYPKGKPFSAIVGDLLGRGIFNSDGRLWRFQRKLASLKLGSAAVHSYALDIVASEIRCRLVPLLTLSTGGGRDSSVVDLQDVFRRFSFDSICRFSFGWDPGCLDPSLPVSDFDTAFDMSSKLSAERALSTWPLTWKLKRFFNLGSEKKLKWAIKTVHQLADTVIKHKRNNLAMSSSSDLLSRFLASVDDDVFLRDIVVSFLLAGRDTVASGLTTFFWLLAQNPRVIQIIREESDRVMGPENGEPASFSQLKKMQYLQAAAHESMRLFPPVQSDSKFCKENDILPDGTSVGRGTRVIYHPYAMGRMDKIWGGDCLDFRPERWLREGIFRPEDPFKYPVFQAGPRACLGKEMAMAEVKAVALSLVRRFDFEVSGSGRGLRFLPGFTAAVRDGLPVVVRKRGV